MMLHLGKRLSVAADMITEGGSVCDVGTDHGYLPVFLHFSGKATMITATDINERPLALAAQNCRKYGAEGIKLVLCDGLDGVTRKEADTVVITGMGGEIISGIIERCGFLKDETVTLILQPMTGADFLREYLAKNGFSVKKETAVSENGKVYSVMKMVYDGNRRTVSDTEKQIGIIKYDTPESREYIDKQYRICSKCVRELKNIPEKHKDYVMYSKICRDIEKLSEENNGV